MSVALRRARAAGWHAACVRTGMVTRFTYRLTQTDGGYLASCQELGLEADGRSSQAAVTALKRFIEERLDAEEAVGPPSTAPARSRIELELAREAEAEPQGPGDSPAAD